MNRYHRASASLLFLVTLSAWSAPASLILGSPGGCPTSAYTGSQLAYTYQVRNKTGSKLSGGQLTLNVALDSKLGYLGYDGSSWSCTPAGNSLACSYISKKLGKNKYTSILTITAEAPAFATSVKTSATASAKNLTATLSCTTAVTMPVASNFEATDRSGNCAGKAINTKIVNQPFSLDIRATSPNSDYNPSTVSVYLIDVAAIGSPPYAGGSNNCPPGLQLDSNNRPRSYIASSTVSLAGRTGVFSSPGLDGAYRNLLVYTIDTSSKANYACSTDSFAVRPEHFTVSAQDQNWRKPGTTRSLGNTAASGGNVHAAGRPFTLTVEARDARGGRVPDYTAAGKSYFFDADSGKGLRPIVEASAVLQPAGGATGNVQATFSDIPAAGTIQATDATYDEAGAILLQAFDDDFAGVDARNTCSSLGDRRIAGSAEVGRFVPDALTVGFLISPRLKTFNADAAACSSRSFTYVGQPFGYAVLPSFTVQAWNYDAESPELTGNYRAAGRLASATDGNRLVAAHIATPAIPLLDGSGVGAPLITDTEEGAVVSLNAADTLVFSRGATPVAPFTPSIALAITVMDCVDRAGTGDNSCIPVCLDKDGSYGDGPSSCGSSSSARVAFDNIAFDAGGSFRYGYLALPSGASAPSPLSSLNIPIQAKYFTAGGSWTVNSDDSCTAIAATAFSFSNFTQNLAACETQAGGGGRLAAGAAVLTLSPPGNGNHGSVDLIANLGPTASGETCVAASASPATAVGVPWLQCDSSYAGNCVAGNPKATATFVGTTPAANKTRHIYLREMF